MIKPPWITDEWFMQCPFNYCDHFGDKLVLARVCKVCAMEIDREIERLEKRENPYDIQVALEDIAENFAEIRKKVETKAKQLGIDIENIPIEEDDEEDESHPILLLTREYGDQVEALMKSLQIVPEGTDIQLANRVMDVLGHSRHFVCVKTARALSSRKEEESDPFMEELADSKTAAFFAYIAVERNARALLTLSRHKPFLKRKEQLLKFAQVSLDVANMLREEFFPSDKLEYEELGYEEFREYLKQPYE